MILPTPRLKVFFYRLRGTKIGENVQIAQMVYLEERYSHLITIGDHVQIGPRVIIATHDSSNNLISRDLPLKLGEVIIGNNVYIGAGAIILPGVSIGDNVLIGAGSLVNKSIPPNSVAVGVPARVIGTFDEWRSRQTN